LKHSAKFLKYIQAQNKQIGNSGKQKKFRFLYLIFNQEIHHREIYVASYEIKKKFYDRTK